MRGRSVLRAARVGIRDPLMVSTFAAVTAYSMLSYLFAVAILNGSSLWILGLAMALPAFVQTLVGTAASFAADHASRNRLYGCGLALLVPSAVLGISAWRGAGASYVLPAAYLTASVGMSTAFSTSSVLVPLRYADDELATVNSALMALAMAASTLGPIIAATTGSLSKGVAYAVAIVLASFGAASGFGVVERPTAHTSTLEVSSEESSGVEQEREGPGAQLRSVVVAILSSTPLRLMTIALSLTWLGIGGINALEVPFIVRTLHGGSSAYAALLSWESLWSFVFATAYTTGGRRLPVLRAFVGGVIVSALGWIAFGFAPDVIVAFAIIIVTGFAGVALNVGTAASLQSLARHEPQIGGVLGTVFGAFHIAGALSLVMFAALADFVLPVRVAIVLEGVVAACAIPFALRVLRPTAAHS